MLIEDYKVVKHNFLINAKSTYKYTLNELKLISHLIANILPSDTNLEIKKVSIRELNFIVTDSNNYSKIGKELEKLKIKIIKLPNGYEVNWFSCLKYENGFIEYSFDTRLKEFLLNINSNFTSYYLTNVLNLKSAYSIRIFELLFQLKDKGYRTIFLNDLRECLGIPISYSNKDIRRLIQNVQKDLQLHTTIQFEFKIVKKGRIFHKVEFIIKNNKKVKGVSYCIANNKTKTIKPKA
ncbi:MULTISPECIES: replication initiation protein [Aliarcobacter]|jgi:plasmid replication initiation protein|uniref:replication initiation protein n=1 Tax=Aliarcobacter TaxID=2321111 RepID=UPI001B6D38BB|nr:MULTISPECIES: replication initiation protein [Aliarcobacter]MBP6714670.1 replication initiation protein [Aliarcobacter sp.]MCT7513458.1 replication initiation protein [Aliarcobacter cryaerophilus]